MSAKEIAAIIAESALKSLVQLPGVDPAELEHIAKAIGNNAAIVLAIALDTES